MHRGALIVGLGTCVSSDIKAGWGGVLTARDPFSCRAALPRGTDYRG